MRKVLVTGLGGAGRTTVAAATALAEAARGRRALFLSADPGDVLGAPVTAAPEEPALVREGLWAARVDAGADFRAEFLDLQERASAALDLLGAARLEDEELTRLPGSEQFALLRALTVASRGGWDVVVVDMPPLHETIALLALPEELRRYLRRLLPQERQAARALRPVLAQLAGVPMPARWLYGTAERWDTELAGVQALIESVNTTLRVVAEPGPRAAAALLEARAGLALHGLAVDALVANRNLPRESADPWLAPLVAQQEKCLHEWYGTRLPRASMCEVPHLGRDPQGLEDLGLLDTRAVRTAAGGDGRRGDGPAAGARAHRGDGLAVGGDPEREGPRPGPGRIDRPEPSATGPGAEDALYVWELELPGVVKEQLSLVRRGDELLIGAGPFRRILPLPSALRRCTVAGAGLADGTLRVRFTPDPGLWPRTH
ncbi:ArsA family ATPase [Streptomyces pristinaespiralis]|uniref:ArsA family ATPase n=1 Tax=Streptomyces pristinaespiralis TaxID=38300 RepID=UPI0033D8FD98